MILTRNCCKEGLQLVCSAGNTAVNVHCRVTQILIEKHPEILSHHQLGRAVATVSLNGDTNSYRMQHTLIPHPLPRPDLDVHADVVRVAGDVEFWTGELQSGAVDRILKCTHP